MIYNTRMEFSTDFLLFVAFRSTFFFYAASMGKINYDIGDYLKRDQKLSIIKNFKSIKQLKLQKKFKKIIPDENFDWINQGNKEYHQPAHIFY